MDKRPWGISGVERGLMLAILRIAFRPVFGWKSTLEPPATGFTVDGENGGSLEAYFLPAGTPSPAGLILMCHPFLKYGMHYFRKNGLDAAFARGGFHVAAFNFKGFGRSRLTGPAFHEDVASMLAWAKAAHPGLPVHLFGQSFGGYHGIHALGRLDGRFVSAAFDSVPPFLGNFFRRGIQGALMRRIGMSRWKDVSGTAPIADSLKLIGRTPVLLIFGEHDEYCSAEDRRKLAGSGRFETRVFPGTGHLEAYKSRPSEYLDLVLGFMLARASVPNPESIPG